MPPAGFEPTISAGERLQTYALDRGHKWIPDFLSVQVVLIKGRYCNRNNDFQPKRLQAYLVPLLGNSATLVVQGLLWDNYIEFTII